MENGIALFGVGIALLSLAFVLYQVQSGRSHDTLKMLQKANATVFETSMTLDFHIKRLASLSVAKGMPTEVSLQGLYTMRSQCETLKAMVADSLNIAVEKGVNKVSYNAVDQWLVTLSVMPRQVELAVMQIEQALNDEPA